LINTLPTAFFWKKAKKELKGNMMFQEASIYFSYKELYKHLQSSIKRYKEIKKEK